MEGKNYNIELLYDIPETIEVTFGEPFILPNTGTIEGPLVGWFYGSQKITDHDGLSLENYNFAEHIVVSPQYYYEIYDKDDLKYMNQNRNGSYKLMNDIYLSDQEWVPIGRAFNEFNGNFDGNGYTIHGLTISYPYDHVGLFGYTSTNSNIKDVKLANVNINIATKKNQQIAIGSLVGYSKGGVENIETLSGYIRVNGSYRVNIGGIIGQSISTSNYLNLTNRLNISNYGINQSDTHIGGIIGYHSNSNLLLNEAFNAGKIYSESEGNTTTAGIIGYASNGFYIANATNVGDINAYRFIGGIIGDTFYDPEASVSSIEGSKNFGNLTGDNFIGGIMGAGTKIAGYNLRNHGDIEGRLYVGGLMGGSYLDSTINDSQNNGNIFGQSHIGGILGTGQISIYISVNTGKVEATDYYAGGFVGTDTKSNMISQTGPVKIFSSMNTGDVIADLYAGGFIGSVDENYTIQTSINFGDVTIKQDDDDKIGGITGVYYASGTVASVYYYNKIFKDENIEVLGNVTGTSIPDVEMLKLGFFTDTLYFNQTKWDLDYLYIPAKIYPRLK